MRRGILFLCLILLLACCAHPKELGEKDLISFLLKEENGIAATQVNSGYTLSLTYRPSDFIAKQQMVSESIAEYDSLRKVYSKYCYFLLDISKDGKDLETMFTLQQEDFASRISFLSSGFAEKIMLVDNGETIAPSDYVYIRTYGNSASRFLLAFEAAEKDVHIIIDGYELGFSRTEFSFRYSDIRKIPKLKL